MKKVYYIFLVLMISISILYAENFASAVARGCTPVVVEPGQTLNSLLAVNMPAAITNNAPTATIGGFTFSNANNIGYFDLGSMTQLVFRMTIGGVVTNFYLP